MEIFFESSNTFSLSLFYLNLPFINKYYIVIIHFFSILYLDVSFHFDIYIMANWVKVRFALILTFCLAIVQIISKK